MSIFAKVQTFFGLEDEEYFEEPVVQPQPRVQRPVSQSQERSTFSPRREQPVQNTVAKETVSRPMADPTRQRTEQQRVARPESPTQSTREKVIAMKSSNNKQTATATSITNKIMIIQPRVYSEAMNIAKHVMSGESVLVNFHLIEEHQARRIVDFLTGTVYAEDGDIKRVADEIFLCTPKGIEIDGTAQSLVDSNFFDV